ncbi:MAG: SOS response-associated peptidase family protein [Pseudomonadota bacterium]
MCTATSNGRIRDVMENVVTGEIKRVLQKRRTRERPDADDEPEFGSFRDGPDEEHTILRGMPDGSIHADPAVFGLRFGAAREQGRVIPRLNARAEGLTTTFPWRFLQGARCLKIADGFYEPEKVQGSKEKVAWSFYQRRSRSGDLDDARPFFIAGLWNEFVTPDGEVVLTYALITVEANEAIRVHDRMPAIIPIEDDQAAMRWLFDPDWPLDLLKPYPAEDMEGWRVSDAAKRSRPRQGRYLIEPVTDEPDQGSLL